MIEPALGRGHVQCIIYVLLRWALIYLRTTHKATKFFSVSKTNERFQAAIRVTVFCYQYLST